MGSYGVSSVAAATLSLRVPRLPSTNSLSEDDADASVISPASAAAVPVAPAAAPAVTEAVLLPAAPPPPIGTTLLPARSSSLPSRQRPASASPNKTAALSRQQTSPAPRRAGSGAGNGRNGTIGSARPASRPGGAVAAAPAAPTMQRLGSRQAQQTADGAAAEQAVQPAQQQQQPPDQPEAAATSAASASERSPSRQRQSRPGSASPTKAARPGSARLPLSERVARQMEREAGSWTVAEVADYCEACGLGAHRRAFVHNAVTGALFLGLTDQQIRDDLGIRSLGHREALVQAIVAAGRAGPASAAPSSPGADSCASTGGGSPEGLLLLDDPPSAGSSRAASPGPGGAAFQPPQCGPLRLQAQRDKLLRALSKAEGKAAHLQVLAEQAVATAGTAADEVQRLCRQIASLDEVIASGGHGGASASFEPYDARGQRAWLPTSTKKARPESAPPPLAATPVGGLGGGSPGPGSPTMSKLSRKLMEGSAAGTFLERLDADINARRDKIRAARAGNAAAAAAVAGRSAATAAAADVAARDLDFCIELAAPRSTELADALRHGTLVEMGEAIDDVSEHYGQELGLSDEQIAAVKAARSPARKAARLAGAVRAGRFMARLEEDLGSRDARLQELKERTMRAAAGARDPEALAAADLKEGAARFALLGWEPAELAAAAGDQASETVQRLLDALLHRAEAVAAARAAGKEVDAGAAAKMKIDGLEELQQRQMDEARRAAEECRAQEAAAGGAEGQAAVAAAPAEQPVDHLADAVALLSRAAPSQLEGLLAATGSRKLLLTYRALRSQEFVASMAAKEEERRRKAADLEAQVYPDVTRRLPKQQLEGFFERLTEDSLRRQTNKEALVEKAKEEALRKLMGTAPPARRGNR